VGVINEDERRTEIDVGRREWEEDCGGKVKVLLAAA